MPRRILRRLWPPRVSAILALAAAAPLLGLVFLTVGDVRDSMARGAAADRTVDTSLRFEDMVRLQAALNSEQQQVRSNATIELYRSGGATAPGSPLLADPTVRLMETQQVVDALVESVGLPGVRRDLDLVREMATRGRLAAGEIGDTYLRLSERADALAEREFHRLQGDAWSSDSGTRLSRAVEVAGVTTELREAMAGQHAAWMGVVTSNAPRGQNPAAALVASSAAYDEAANRMDRLVDPSSRAAHRWSDLRADPVNVLVRSIYMDQVAHVLELGFDGEFDTTNVLFELDDYTTVTATAPVVAENHIMVVDAALADMGDLAESARLSAIGERHEAILIAAAVAALVVLSATLLLRSVLWPLRRLGTVAEALRRGSLDEHLVEHGLRETRSVAEAMNEAVDHLKLAERQALALADERLDDPVLEESVPGLLGSSLQGAVGRLTSSLNEREEFARKLAYEATHDGLTQLANRKATLDHLERALARVGRGEGFVGVLFIDIDGFKTVNDTFGHAAGDLVLVTVAERLKASLRQGDLAGRLGGDEFLVVLEPLATPEDAALMAERLLSTLGEPVHHDEATIVPSASIGVASTNGLGLDATELVRDADLAVYRAKGSGRGRVEVCDEDLRASIANRSEVDGALATAIADGELRLFFQPVVLSPSNRVVSAEALVRWERPGHGLIQPDDFVPIAEEGNQILALDRWVLGQACRQLQEWSEDPRLSAIDIAVNLSGRHLADASVVDDVLNPLRVAGVDPAKMVIEITESAFLEDFDQAAQYLRRLREAGVRIALDDFGTGFTSLAHLRSLPIDMIKIDRSFVADMAKAHDETVAQLIVNAGHLLNMTVVAEGVEDGEQLARLEAIGCDMMQGFYFSAPVPGHDFATLVREELFAGS